MPDEAVAFVETILEEIGHHRLAVSERDEAVADVARRQDAELLAQAAARPAVIGDGDDRREVRRVLLEAAQQGGEPGAAADRDDPAAAVELAALVDDLEQPLAVLRADRVDDGSHPLAQAEIDERHAADHEEPLERRRLEPRALDDDAIDGLVDVEVEIVRVQDAAEAV